MKEVKKKSTYKFFPNSPRQRTGGAKKTKIRFRERGPDLRKAVGGQNNRKESVP